MRRKFNSSGKVLTVFLIVMIILAVSLAAISIFFFQKEVERRKTAEAALEKIKTSEKKLGAELQDAIKQGFLLQEKNKEADEKINGLLDELELQEGLREELKQENAKIKEQLDQEKKTNTELQEKLAKGAEIEQKIAELEGRLQTETDAKRALEERIKGFEDRNKELEENLNRLKQLEATGGKAPVAEKASIVQEEVELEKIVIAPEVQAPAAVSPPAPEGRILTVDVETEFVVVNLGSNHNMAVDKILSVYRADNYLGDIKITRVQPEMSAADFIPPFSSRQAQKNDRVVVK